MHHLHGRVVAHDPAGRYEAPDNIDVFAETQTLVEATDGLEGRPPDHQRGRRHVGNSSTRSYTRGRGPEIEGAVFALVALEEGRPRSAAHPGGDPHYRRVVEVTDEASEPFRGGLDIGIQKCDERGIDLHQPGCAGGARASGDLAADKTSAMAAGHGGDGFTVDRSVVDDHDRRGQSGPSRGGQAAFQARFVVSDRHDDGDASGLTRFRDRMGHSRIDQHPGELSGRGGIGHRCGLEPSCGKGCTAIGETQDLQRRATDQYPPVVADPQTRIGTKHQAGRHRRSLGGLHLQDGSGPNA